MKTFAIVSLGCSRNLVDSEVIAGRMAERGLKRRPPGKGADLYIINTCSFIESARAESVDAILDAARLKEEGRVGRIAVCGCLPQMYKGKLLKPLPEVDALIGSSDYPALAGALGTIGRGRRYSRISTRPSYLYDGAGPRSPISPRHYAYIKIAEGCSNLCSYCVISKLRGRFRSRPISSVLDEAMKLSARGHLREIILVGQDITLFGSDRRGGETLAGLVKALAGTVSGVGWIRLMYTHPAHFDDELITVIRDEKKVCRYIDLPVQHINDRVLRRMNRRTTKRQILGLIGRLRRSIPGLTLRTSIIVGFPGETDGEFRELLSFVRDTGFERLGAFTYSREAGTAAARMSGQVSEAVKRERYDELMRVQQAISLRANRRMVGRRVRVLVDEKVHGQRVFAGRTGGDAPEVDNTVYVSGGGVKAGEFCEVRVTDAMEYDLVGEAV